ncbi:iron-containing redox enzyme family protein [Kitasatospora sp. NPDC058162]|uniref:iron-containing redox enzyme family protein n=1 Tax=Kitasatospora sp. NPDC058162 TaxID=3346362 RepID=UPI0036DDBE63
MTFLNQLTELAPAELAARLDEFAVSARDDRDGSGYLDAQRALYLLSVARWQPAWESIVPSADETDVVVASLRLSRSWHQAETDRVLGAMELPSIGEFGEWLDDRCRAHASGPQHPLFDFLENQATEEQLREFVFQETPFDVHFGDLVAALIPGVYGAAKLELAHNFWDEMGNGDIARTHRQLRLDMMSAVGIDTDAHVSGLDRFWVEELELANMYLGSSTDRTLMAQGLGMLLATEHVVPGRIDRQIKGWLRVGYGLEQLEYLTEHVTVDVAHAAGWLNEVIKPTLAAHPECLPDIVAGVERRLAGSLRVCDVALKTLTSVA